MRIYNSGDFLVSLLKFHRKNPTYAVKYRNKNFDPARIKYVLKTWKIDGTEKLTNGSICVSPKKCIIHFEPGHTYMQNIKLLNMTDRPQIIKIQPLESKIFKFPCLTTVSILPNLSWNLQFTFMTYSNREYKSYLHLKNPTGQGNLAIELRAVPKTHSRLPKTIDFGNVDIGMSVTRKLSLAPKSKPYQFRIFIPYGLEHLSVNPTCGEVLCDYPTNVSVVYTPQSYITLCIDLVLYLTGFNQKPQVITLTAVTKHKSHCMTRIKTDFKMPKKLHLHSFHKTHSDKTEKDIIVFNRLTLNKMLVDKDPAFAAVSYMWLNPLGELDRAYRDTYVQDCKDFMVKAKRFGDENKKDGLKISRHELNVSDELQKLVYNKRICEWKTYKEQLHSYEDIISLNARFAQLGLRERSIRTNYVDTSEYDFDPIPDDNWCIRFQMYNKFINAIKIIIVKNRLEKRLYVFRELIANNLINTCDSIS